MPIVDCPTCKQKAEYSPANRWRPFCSERCRQIDLGAWASGAYSIPVESPDPDGEPDAPGRSPPDWRTPHD